MSRIHKQVVSVQKATDGANSGATMSSDDAAAAITKHSAFLATALNNANGVTFNPIYYTADGNTLAGTATLVKKENSPLYIPSRLHSFTGLVGGDLTFLA